MADIGKLEVVGSGHTLAFIMYGASSSWMQSYTTVTSCIFNPSYTIVVRRILPP